MTCTTLKEKYTQRTDRVWRLNKSAMKALFHLKRRLSRSCEGNYRLDILRRISEGFGGIRKDRPEVPCASTPVLSLPAVTASAGVCEKKNPFPERIRFQARLHAVPQFSLSRERPIQSPTTVWSYRIFPSHVSACRAGCRSRCLRP